MNRVVRRYDQATGKHCVAHDKFLEHSNVFFSNFPMPRLLVGFVEQSVYLGFGLMCRVYTDQSYMTAWNMMKTSDYQKTATMTPEKKAIYEILNLFETHVNKS